MLPQVRYKKVCLEIVCWTIGTRTAHSVIPEIVKICTSRACFVLHAEFDMFNKVLVLNFENFTHTYVWN